MNIAFKFLQCSAVRRSAFLAAMAIFYAAVAGTNSQWRCCAGILHPRSLLRLPPSPVISTCSAASPMCSSCTDGRAEPSTIPTCSLNAFLSGGWLAGFCYLALAAVTIVMSTRFLFVPTPWQPIYHAIYAAYVGTMAESAIIDIDHRRHYFLILGLLWGLMAASRQYVAAAPGAASLRPAIA
jgi:hypothetical protein